MKSFLIVQNVGVILVFSQTEIKNKREDYK